MQAAVDRVPVGGAMDRVLVTGLVDTADVARVLNITLRSVQRWSSRAASPRKGSEERLLELAVVLDRAAEVLPEEDARLWIRSPIADLGWRKPLDVISEGNFRDVIDALEAFSEGVIQ
jgi:putative toxin-antitoxin system antitoxin component (TIGR02293 family)